MAKIPAYQDQGGLDTGSNFFQLARPNTDVAAGLTALGNAAGNLADARVRASLKAQHQAKADDNLRLEKRLMDFQNDLRDETLKRQEDMPEGGFGFHQGVTEYSLGLRDQYQAEFANRPDQDYVALRFAKAAEPVADQTAGIEFRTRMEWRQQVSEAKVGSLVASVAADPANIDQAGREWEEFVKTTIGGGENIQAKGLVYGKKLLGRAHAESIAAKRPVDFRTHFQGAFENMPAKNAEPHIAQTVQSARDNGVDPRWQLAMGWIESRLNPAAGEPIGRDGKPMSSAKGMWQILAAPDTLNELGLTKENRTDVNVATPAISRFMAKQQASLQSSGIPVTPGKLYMTWNIGPGAARAVMRADPNTPIETVLSRVWAKQGPEFVADALRNNPQMYRPGMTVGQVLANYENKMSGAMKATDKLVSGQNMTTDEQAQTLFRGMGVKYADHLTARDAAEIFIKTDGAIGKQTKEDAKLQLGTTILNGDVKVDRYDTDNQSAVNEVVARTDVGAKVAAGEPEAHVQARNMIETAGFIPAPIINGYREAINSAGSGDAKARAYAALTDIATNNPVALDASKLPDDEKSRIKEYRAYTEVLNLSPEQAVKRIDYSRSPDGQKIKEASADAVRKELKSFTWGDLADHFDESWFSSPSSVDPARQDLAMSGYRSAYEYHRGTGKSAEEAQALAVTDLRQSWGTSHITGQQIFMPHPPEKYYGAVDGSHEWLIEQARRTVGTELSMSGKLKDIPQRVEGAQIIAEGKTVEEQIRSLEVRLVPRAETAQDVRSGKPPRYELWYRKPDGSTEVIRDRWFTPDETLAKQQKQARDEEAIRNRKRPEPVPTWSATKPSNYTRPKLF